MPLISCYEKVFMKTKTLTNSKFIALVKEHECLWNQNCHDYYKTSLHSLAWIEIAKKVGSSVQSCQTRWRSISRAFGRSFHQTPTGKPKKPYYLTPHLDFMRPFCKASCSRLLCGNKNCFGDKNGTSDDFNNEDLDESHDGSISVTESYSDETQAHDTNEKKQIEEETTHADINKFKDVEKIEKMAEVKQPNNENDSDHGQLHNQIKIPETEPPCSINMMFFNSLVPFIEEMSKSQVRQFRRGVLAIIDAIEDERENQ